MNAPKIYELTLMIHKKEASIVIRYLLNDLLQINK